MTPPRFDRSPRIRVVESSAAELRLAEARAFIAAHARGGEDIHIVGASRGAVDDLVRSIAAASVATLGLHRFSLTHLAVRLAEPALAANRESLSTHLAAEAVAARAAFEAQQEGALSYFAPVAQSPGFARALARTVRELRLAHVDPAALGRLPLGGADLATLLASMEAQFSSTRAGDRASLFKAATDVVRGGSGLLGIDLTAPLVLLDVPFDSAVEFDFVGALMEKASATLVTVPFGDLAALERLRSSGLAPDVLVQTGDADLVALRRYMFAGSRLSPRTPRGDVRFFSAPGEGRECVEVARRILAEVRGGVRFDEIAVFLRAPQRYTSLLEHAFRRAGIEAWFERGTQRPHVGGRAFLALLACRCERLSARRFAEYLSLSQVPPADGSTREFTFVVPDDEVMGSVRAAAERTAAATGGGAKTGEEQASPPGDGSLPTPLKWEKLLVESSVIGGDPARWHRRLNGLEQEYRLKIRAESAEDPGSARIDRLRRDLENLDHLRAFALPVIDELATWPAQGTWGEWLDRFTALAPRVLRRPDVVTGVLRELRPMSDIGPISLEEARDVIAERLRLLESEPPKSRYGRVFVGSPHQARGRTFKVVFVPGLAERMFPQKPHEDPMLLDAEMRVPLDARLPTQRERGQAERLLLRLGVGSATERLWLSYPRIEIAESRPRVPSFYALDVMRAITGRIPNHEELQESAAAQGGAGLAWPSPADPSVAIDDLEHDLAVLRELLQAESRTVRGHAHYLLRLNPHLKRSVTSRWARARSQWTPFDGITRVNSHTQPMLESQRLGARPYSLSALQRFAACPYQFLLASIHRLEPSEEPAPLQRLDPLMRGALFHEVQAEFFRAMQASQRLPVREQDLGAANAELTRVISRVSAKYKEKLAPAIDRVWNDEIADIAKDLRVWVRRLPDAGDWVPAYFEFSFGLPADLANEGRDPASLAEPILVDGRFKLRGSVDLIERKRGSDLLRVTDHKTGRNRTTWKTVIGGGAVLQPVLYSAAVERGLAAQVTAGRLFYCTAAGGFNDHEIPLNDATRRAGIEALEIIDRAIELGFLPAAPSAGACTWCDFRVVCGPHEEQRVARKPAEKLADLAALRQKP